MNLVEAFDIAHRRVLQEFVTDLGGAEGLVAGSCLRGGRGFWCVVDVFFFDTQAGIGSASRE
ncbi:hypothetical protein GCM10009585_03330 [Brevibacterium paucivorans]